MPRFPCSRCPDLAVHDGPISAGIVNTAATGGRSSTPGAGGATSAGGSGTSGATLMASGGSATSGGSVSSNVSNTSNASETGGAATGGVSATGGVTTGGAPAAGGAAAGGRSSVGGNAPSGGSVATGGKWSLGGTLATGGGVTGGKSATGGMTANGGSAVTGGKTSAGGTTSASTSTSGCSRAMLQAAVDSYLAALKAGSASNLPSGVSYKENNTTVALTAGLWATPLQVDLLPPLTLLDVDKCQSYSEIIIDNNHKYILGSRLTVTGSSGQLSAINVLTTECKNAWLFNADTYLKYSKQEQDAGGWGPVAPADQLTRQALMDAGAAYFAYWSDTTVQVPWGYPCSRLEGGAETNPTGDKNTTCSVGIPANTPVKVSDQLVDVDYGMVVDFLGLPGPDSHWFRVNKDGIRYVHTLTNCMLNGSWQCPSSAPTCS